MAEGIIDGPIDGGNPKGESVFRTNYITFTPDGDNAKPIYLTLAADFQITAGVKPNVNAFTCRCDEFEKFGGNLDVEGTLRFYFNPRAPDGSEPVWRRMQIVDVEMSKYGQLVGGPIQIIEYRLMIADRRHNFIEPRGGYLEVGDINIGKFDNKTGLDENGNGLMNTKEVVDLCLDAMGIDVGAPAGITKASPPGDLRWRGNHAPTELAKILDYVQWTMILRQDATIKLEKIGDGQFEYNQSSDHVAGFTVPGVERKGKAVVFSSQPTQVMDSIVLHKFEKGELELVCVDSDGKWKPLAELKVLNGWTAKDTVRNKFANVPEEWRNLLRTYIYRCFRLDPKKYNTILREYQDPDGQRRQNFQVQARTALTDGNGTWRTAQGLVNLHPVALLTPPGALSVVVLSELLGNVGAGVSSDLEADFHELLNDYQDLRVAVSVDCCELAKRKTRKLAKDDPEKLQPEYFLCGFAAGPGGKLEKLSQDDVRNLRNQDGSIVIARPELQLYRVEGTDQNRAELEKACELLAPRWLKGSGSPTETHIFKGFFNGNLSGMVSEISYSQTPPMSTVKVMHWWLPSGKYLGKSKEATGDDKGGVGGDAPFPKQGATEVQRVGLGSAGSAQPAVPLNAPAVLPPAAAGPILVNVYKLDTGAGAKYYGHPLAGKTTVTEAGGLAMPEGMTPGDEDILILNLLEDRKATHWMLYTRAHMCNVIGRMPAAADGTPGKRVGVIEVPNPCEIFICALTVAGGANGDQASAPSYACTWKNLQGDTLADNRQPQEGRAVGKLVGPATKGHGYFDNEGAFQPLFAYETPDAEVCP